VKYVISIKQDKYERKRERKHKIRVHSKRREVMQESILRECDMRVKSALHLVRLHVEWCVIW
jgi:hypothetical protein